ncbi:MAG: Mur ligase domain-containing protein [Candidatus Krumholzibacteriota bacterium]
MSSSDSSAIRTDTKAWLHFAGLGGSGMSGLAQFHARAGGPTTGSDRAFDQGERQEVRSRLEGLGIGIFSQDGSFSSAAEPGEICAGQTCAAVVVSTAVEDKVPDIAAARELGIPILHRSELLARYVTDHRTIAVSGTSGKSTVTAMLFTILRDCGLDTGLLTGGPLTALVNDGLIGNAWAPAGSDQGDGPPFLVIEADESDGSLVRYHPWAGIILNLGLDHKDPAEIMAMFEVFRDNVSGPLIVGADDNLADLAAGAEVFGIGEGDDRAGTWARDVEPSPTGSDFRIENVRFHLPAPGLYNVRNATAAIAAGRACGLTLEQMAPAVAGFAGVSRRFEKVGDAAGVEVIDDFAHNPDKIAAALAAAHDRLGSSGGRVLAVFQPHGFGPTRFLRDALVETFAAALAPEDVLWLPEIYFAGGTVTRDISAGDIVDEVRGLGREARFLADRAQLPPAIAAEARSGDLVLVMGARDPSLTEFGRTILLELGKADG